MAMRVLRQRDFRRLLGAHVVSQVGTGVTSLAIPLIAVTVLHASPLMIGILAAASTVPLLLLGLPAGVWVDRRKRKPLMVGGDIGRFALLMLLPISAVFGWLSYPLLFAIVSLVGCFTVVFDIASQSYVTSLLDREDLVGGNSMFHSSYAVGEIIGPGIAGTLVSVFKAPIAVTVDAVSFLVSGILIAGIRHQEVAPESKPTGVTALRAELTEGLRAVRDTPVLRTLGLATGVWNLFEGARDAMLILFITQTLHISAQGTGIIYSIAAAGWLVGSMLTGIAAAKFGLGRAIMLGALLVIPCELLIPLAGGPPLLAGAMVAAGYFLSGVAGPIYDVNQYSLRQAITPDHLQGRVSSVLRVIIRGTEPLGALLGGLIAEWLGLRGAMWAAVFGPPIAIALIWFSPVRRMQVMPSADSAANLSEFR